ncbi:hypothetical protein AAGW05_11670 [Arthrobacter sp. LAPM80]|uniref:hypothetical protein n=1 Tax=Arthrobacter sp. LAPM80 TaxID=3141788 RepID=UPI00398B40BA
MHPEFLDSPFTVKQAQAEGISYGRLRHREVLRISRGIRTLAHDDDIPVALLTRPFTVVTGYSAASHATAFAIWELPGHLPGADTDTIHIARQYPHASPRRSGVQGHRTMLRDEELVVVADHLIRMPREAFEGRTEPYASLEELHAVLFRHSGTPGIVKARAGLPEPLLNHPTLLSDGVVRSPDQSYPDYKVASEYDGGTHNDPDQVERDVRRNEDYTGAGWTEVRIMKRHMADDAREAVGKIRNAIWDRGWRPTPGS